MYGDLLLDRLGVKFLGPAPLHLQLLHMLSTFHWNALGSTGFGRRLGRRKQIFGKAFPFRNVPCKNTTCCTKTGSPVERMNITFVPGGNMVVLPSSISAKVSKMSCQECKGYKWQCPTTQSPTQQHSEPQRKILC